jgi:hypothetical protein
VGNSPEMAVRERSLYAIVSGCGNFPSDHLLVVCGFYRDCKELR